MKDISVTAKTKVKQRRDGTMTKDLVANSTIKAAMEIAIVSAPKSPVWIDVMADQSDDLPKNNRIIFQKYFILIT